MVELFSRSIGSDSEFYIMLGVIGFLVLLGGIFSGLTIGLMSLDSTNMAILMRSGTETEKRWVARIEPIRQNTHLLLVTLLLSNTVVNEALPVLFHYVNWDGYQAVLISTVLVVIFGEILPQAVCTRYSLAIGAFFAYPVRILIIIMWIIAYPIARLLDWTLGSKHGITYRRAELKELVAMHGEDQEGPLNPDEVSILRSVLELRDKSVKNVMTTLEHVHMLSLDSKLDEESMKLVLQAGHSRIPVYNGERQNIVGVVIVKQLILYDPSKAVPIAGIKIRRLPRVRADTPLFEILQVFKSGGSHMAVVVEEVTQMPANYIGTLDPSFFETSSPLVAAGSPQVGGTKRYRTLGIVTLEDVMEELLGSEIIDETDVFVNMETGLKVRRTYREVKSRAGLLDSKSHSGLLNLLPAPKMNQDEEREPLLRERPTASTSTKKEPDHISEDLNRILTSKVNDGVSHQAPELKSPLLVPRTRNNSGGSVTSRNNRNKNKRDQVLYEAQRLANHVEQHLFGNPPMPHNASTVFLPSSDDPNSTNKNISFTINQESKTEDLNNLTHTDFDVNYIEGRKATQYGSLQSDASGTISKTSKDFASSL